MQDDAGGVDHPPVIGTVAPRQPRLEPPADRLGAQVFFAQPTVAGLAAQVVEGLPQALDHLAAGIDGEQRLDLGIRQETVDLGDAAQELVGGCGRGESLAVPTL